MKCMQADPDTLKEVSILASINSPYIVKYMDSFIEGNKLYLIMEYCEKGDISTYITEQDLEDCVRNIIRTCSTP